MESKDNLDELINRGHRLMDDLKLTSGINAHITQNYFDFQKWLNDVEIFKNKYLKDHPLAKRMDTAIFHQRGRRLFVYSFNVRKHLS